MSAQVIDASLELIQWLKGPPLETDDSAQQEEKTKDEPPAKCRPDSVEDYARRLQTFRVHLWFNRPLALSPIECARWGWRCTGVDAIACEVCGASASVQRADGGWLVDGERVEVQRLAASVARCHSVFCPWRSHEASPANLGRLSDKDLSDQVEARVGTLLELRHRPLLTNDFRTDDPLEVLARAGWERAAGLGLPTAGDPKDAQEHLQCTRCLRVVSVQSFSHCLLDPVAACGEPAKKSARLSVLSLMQRGLDAVIPPAPDQGTPVPPGSGFSNEVIPPAPDQWTPVPPGSGSSKEGLEIAMDPYARHHFYCPLYSPEDDGLSPFAARVARARTAELARAGAGTSGEVAEDSEQKSTDGGPAATSAVEQAEDLLRALDDLLPPS